MHYQIRNKSLRRHLSAQRLKSTPQTKCLSSQNKINVKIESIKKLAINKN